MRHLILMRHAKSYWGDSSVSDHERRLNARGRRDAPVMANWLLDQGFKPDQILCSSARRTIETSQLMNQSWPRDAPVHESSSLYLASAEAILHTIGSVQTAANDAQFAKLMVLAHNPGISQLAAHLAGEFIQMPTAAVIVLRCHVTTWQDPLTRDSVEFETEMTPKQIDA
ncbi:MAG: histidine phosphatase family protein [Planctomycetota bacterium]